MHFAKILTCCWIWKWSWDCWTWKMLPSLMSLLQSRKSPIITISSTVIKSGNHFFLYSNWIGESFLLKSGSCYPWLFWYINFFRSRFVNNFLERSSLNILLWLAKILKPLSRKWCSFNLPLVWICQDTLGSNLRDSEFQPGLEDWRHSKKPIFFDFL